MAILELYLLSKKKEKKNEQFASDGNNTGYYVLIAFYVVITLYVAIAFPLAGNLAVSLIMAILLTPIFWIFKLVEILIGATKRGAKKGAKKGLGK